MEMVIRDDVSKKGLHRKHVMRPGPMTEAEANQWAMTVIDQAVDGGALEASLVYREDELDLWHVRVYWRA